MASKKPKKRFVEDIPTNSIPVIQAYETEDPVSQEEILEPAGKDNIKVFVTRVTIWLTWFIVFLILISLTAIMIDLSIHTTTLPKFPSNVKSKEEIELFSLLIDEYESLNDLVVSRVTNIFRLVILETLVPLFTLMLGYLYGKREG